MADLSPRKENITQICQCQKPIAGKPDRLIKRLRNFSERYFAKKIKFLGVQVKRFQLFLVLVQPAAAPLENISSTNTSRLLPAKSHVR